jgi:REP element-mobilizing transposase RayT
MGRRGEQLSLEFPRTWGGKREGAGRKPGSGRPGVAHRARPPHRATEPVHVTLRSAFKPLRSQFVFPTLRGAIAKANSRAEQLGGRCRVVHFSVQFDHIHLIVEAPSRKALSRGVAGLTISIARRVNALVERRGRVFADRWHGRALTSPRAVRHALVYVLANFRKHDARRAQRAEVDGYSSAPYFTDFAEYSGKAPLEVHTRPRSWRILHGTDPPTVAARTWLLADGWRRRGRISIREAPRA